MVWILRQASKEKGMLDSQKHDVERSGLYRRQWRLVKMSRVKANKGLSQGYISGRLRSAAAVSSCSRSPELYFQNKRFHRQLHPRHVDSCKPLLLTDVHGLRCQSSHCALRQSADSRRSRQSRMNRCIDCDAEMPGPGQIAPSINH